MFGLSPWLIGGVLAACFAGWLYTDSLISKNEALAYDNEKYRVEQANYILAIDALQADIREKAKLAAQYRQEAEQRRDTIRVVNRRLENVLKSNKRWADPDLPDDVNSWLCGVEAKTSAGSDPALCPAGKAGPDTSTKEGGQKPRGTAPSSGERIAGTGRVQRRQASDSRLHYSTTQPTTGEYQRINKALIARNREKVK